MDCVLRHSEEEEHGITPGVPDSRPGQFTAEKILKFTVKSMVSVECQRNSSPFTFDPAISHQPVLTTEGSFFSHTGRVSFIDLRSHGDVMCWT